MLKWAGCHLYMFLLLLVHNFFSSLSVNGLYSANPVNVINAGLTNNLFLKTLKILNEEVPVIISNQTVPSKENCHWLYDYSKNLFKQYKMPLLVLRTKAYCSDTVLNNTQMATVTLDKAMKSESIHYLMREAIHTLNLEPEEESVRVIAVNHSPDIKSAPIIFSCALLILSVFCACAVFCCKVKRNSPTKCIGQKKLRQQSLRKPTSPKNSIRKIRNKERRVIIEQSFGNNKEQCSENNNSLDNNFIGNACFEEVSDVEWVITKPKQRSTYELISEPIKSDEFYSHLQKIAGVIVKYSSNPESYDVTADVKPGDIFTKIPKTGPENPEPFENVCSDFEQTVLNGLTHWQHPRFHAYFPAGRNYACMLADLAISSLGVVGFSWDSCPALTEMEHSMTNWVGRALGLPESFLFQEPIENSKGGGCLLESSSDAIHNVLLASRHKRIEELLGHGKKLDESTDILQRNHDFCKKFVVYTSKEAHSSIEKGCKLTMMNCRKITTKIENDYGLTGEEVETEILKDLEMGLIPLHIHVTLGTTSTGASDRLETIWPIAKKYKLWLHVDAAYSGSTWIIPSNRSESMGIENADSVNVNAHKLLQHSVGCCILWVKDQNVYKNAFRIHPVYLQPTHHNSNDLRDWGVSLSRRFICLKSWFIFRLYGIRGLQTYVQNLVDSAIYFENLVASHPNCRIFGKRKHALFCFQYVEANIPESAINELTRKFCVFVNRSRLMYFTLTQVQDHVLIRISVNFEKSNPTVIDESWNCLKSLIEKFKESRYCLNENSLQPSPVEAEPQSLDRKLINTFEADETCRDSHQGSLSQLFSDE